jgi:ELWxxDGT repeat protein
VGTTLYFAATDASGTELWRSDGTALGTFRVRDITPGANSGFGGFGSVHWNAASGQILLAANDGAAGLELWETDGTEVGTVLVRDIRSGTGSSTPSQLTDVNGVLFFRASDGEIAFANGPTGTELWRSDGTVAGTFLVRDIRPGSASSNPNNLLNVGGTLFFSADDGTSGTELWTSDGTEAGTLQVLDIFPGASGSNPSWFAAVDGVLYFAASDGTNGTELWRSDGTAAGTSMVRDIRAGSSGSSPLSLTDLNGTLVFRANDGATGTELWASDGTSAGTFLVRDIWPGSSTGIGITQGFNVIGGVAFFGANDGVAGSELWRTDGTSGGTFLVRDINPGAGGSVPTFPTVLPVALDGVHYFVASDGTSGHELWRSDGTDPGTVRVRDINPGAGDGFINVGTGRFQVQGSTLIFPATDGSSGTEPWQSDGSEPGTQRVADVFPGATGGMSSTSWMSAAGGRILFSATDPTAGSELWQTDGSTTGTFRVADIAPGAPSSTPVGPFVVSGANVFFQATTDAAGSELWALPLAALVDTDGDGLDDATEASLGTNPNDADTDDDGLADGAEVNLYGTSPLSTDSDVDGSSDSYELGAGSSPLVPDSDGDGFADGADNCPSISNATQADSELPANGGPDGVGDACDSCTAHFNPRVAQPTFQASQSWMTVTGWQRDDDADGRGNRCDFDYDNAGVTIVAADFNQMKASVGKLRTLDICGSPATQQCAEFDHSEGGVSITADDFNLTKAAVGKLISTAFPRCASCGNLAVLPCQGDNCP